MPASVTRSELTTPGRVREPTMSERVNTLFQSRAVRSIDLGCNFITGILGVAALVGAITLAYIGGRMYGWSPQAIPGYGFLGVVAFSGTVLSVLSIKWMIEGCRRRKEFLDDLHEVSRNQSV